MKDYPDIKKLSEIILADVFKPRPYLLPFESPIEEELYRAIQKYLHENTILRNQVEIPTPNGNFRLDFMVSIEDHHVALEANGKEFHHYDKDMMRGSLVLGYSDIHSIYYIRGRDIMAGVESALCALSRKEPEIFSKRGIINLSTLSKTNFPGGYECDDFEIMYGYAPWEDSNRYNEPKSAYQITCLSKSMNNPIWKRLFAIGLDYPGKNAEELITIGDEEGRSWYSDLK